MWTEKKKNGTLYVERYKNPMTGKYFRVSVIMDKETNRNGKLAAEILTKKRDEVLAATSVTVKEEGLTLSDLIEHYKKDQARTVKKSTYIRNVHACNSIMDILGADTLVNMLTAGYVKEKLQERDESNGTINERITRFKALIRWGYRNDYIEDIKWLDKLIKLKDTEKKERIQDKYFERDELNKLLDGMACEHWKMFTEFIALTGMRVGEAIALKKDHIDLKNKTILINENYDYINKIVVSTKTDSSNREISIQKQLEKLIHRINAFYLRQSLENEYKTDLLFSSEDGGYINYYDFNKYLKENSERVLNKHATTHILRHTHVSLLAENGIPIELITRRCGHSNSAITKEVYFHITERLKKRDAEMIANLNII